MLSEREPSSAPRSSFAEPSLGTDTAVVARQSSAARTATGRCCASSFHAAGLSSANFMSISQSCVSCSIRSPASAMSRENSSFDSVWSS